jgi:hypothetical protein
MAFSKKRSRGAESGSSEKPSGAPHRREGVSRSGSEKRNRQPIIGFRASAEERACIQADADRVGLTVSSYVRSRSLKKPTTRAVRRAPVETAQLAQLLGLLGAASGELHRIEKTFTTGNALADTDTRAALTSVREAAAAIMQALGKRAP